MSDMTIVVVCKFATLFQPCSRLFLTSSSPSSSPTCLSTAPSPAVFSVARSTQPRACFTEHQNVREYAHRKRATSAESGKQR